MTRPWTASEPAPPPAPIEPGTFDCRARRHKVITADGICCLCGARGVIDARRLPVPLVEATDVDPLAL